MVIANYVSLEVRGMRHPRRRRAVFIFPLAILRRRIPHLGIRLAAVMMVLVHGGKEVHHEGEDVKGEDEGDYPFEHRGSIEMF